MSGAILFYIDSLKPAGGQERVVAKHIGYSHTESKVILLTKDNGDSFYELPESIDKYSLDTSTELNMRSRLSRIRAIVGGLFMNRQRLRSKLVQLEPSLIYVSSPRNLLEVWVATCRLSNIVVSEHSAYQAHNFVYKLVILVLYRFFNKFLVPTLIDSKRYQKLFIRNHYVPNPLPFDTKRMSTQESKVVLCIGRFTPDKQHLLLIDIWERCKIRSRGWTLKLIGDGELYSEIRQRISSSNLNESIVIQAPTREVINEYINASIFVLTSKREGFGLVLAEALSCGLPVMAFAVEAGPLEIVKNGLNGFLIEGGNTKEFASRLDDLASNEVGRKAMVLDCVESVARFSDSKVRDLYLKAVFWNKD